MNKQEFNGKTIDEALAAAARAFGTDVSLLSYNILPQTSGGLFSKLFQRGVRLEAWVDDKNDVQAAAREAVRQAMSATPEASDRPQPRERNQHNKDRQAKAPERDSRNSRAAARSPRELRGEASQSAAESRGQQGRSNVSQPQAQSARAQPIERSADDFPNERTNRPRSALTSHESKALLIELAERFARGFDPGFEQSPQLEFINEEEVVVTVEAPNLEQLLTRSDRLSCAFEHLFKRIAQKRFGDVSGRVALNSGGAAQEREDKLRAMALDVANKVKETGKTVTLSSKSNQERRVIHLALENMEGIATKSVGVGDNRKLIIYSTNRPSRSLDDSQPRGNRPRQGERGRGPASQTRWNNNPQQAAEAGEQQPRRSRRRGRRGGGANRNAARRDGVQEKTSDVQSTEQENASPSLNN